MSAKKYHSFNLQNNQPIKPNKDEVKCGSQVSFCVSLSFEQELVQGTSGLVSLSTLATNNDNISGTLKMKFNDSLSKIVYALYIFNATGSNNQITEAHLHSAPANRNGPVVVSLFMGPARNVNGLLVKGYIDNRSIKPSDEINSVASLYQAIRDGSLYVNTHSQQYPDGVIRGQIYMKDSCFNK